jgi:hypothetical protein
MLVRLPHETAMAQRPLFIQTRPRTMQTSEAQLLVRTLLQLLLRRWPEDVHGALWYSLAGFGLDLNASIYGNL